MASSNGLASVKYEAARVRYATKGEVNKRSQVAREELRRLLDAGEINHGEHYRALILIDNAYANRIVDSLPPQFRQQLTTPMRVSA